jgi:hypothetical protein
MKTTSENWPLLNFSWIAAELESSDIYALLPKYDTTPENLPGEAVTIVQEALPISRCF